MIGLVMRVMIVYYNVSFGEMVNFQRKALEEAIEYGLIEKAEAFDMLGDRVVFNDFFDSLNMEDY